MERRRFVSEARRGAKKNGSGNGGVEGRIVAKDGGKAGEELGMGEESAESPGSGESPVGNTCGNVVEYEGGIRGSGGDEMGETTFTGDGKGIREIGGGVGHDGGFGAPAVEVFPVERGEGRDGGEVVEARSVGGESGKGPTAVAHLEGEAEGQTLVHITPAPFIGDGRGGGDGGFHAKAASDSMDGIGKGENGRENDGDSGEFGKVAGADFKEGKAEMGCEGIEGDGEEKSPTALPAGGDKGKECEKETREKDGTSAGR